MRAVNRAPAGWRPPISEAELQAAVMEAAAGYGWRVVHFRPARTARGWRTPVEGDGEGWPDLFMLRPPRAVFVELKRDARTAAAAERQLSPAQKRWRDDFRLTPAVEYYVWRPRDWPDSIERILRR